MTDSRAQSTYQVRLGWGAVALATLAPADIVVVVDAVGGAAGGGSGSATQGTAADALAQQALALPHSPTVFIASLRNAAATAQAAHAEQLARNARTAIALVLVGDDGAFAVEDYLAAGAIGDALSTLGIDHTAPDLAVAIEGFRPLTRAVKHLVSASATGVAEREAGRSEGLRAAVELNADDAAIRLTPATTRYAPHDR